LFIFSESPLTPSLSPVGRGPPIPRDSEELRWMKWQLKRKAEDELEKVFLNEALRRNRGNVSRTALDVGMDRRQLQNLIRKRRIVVKEYKDSSSSTQ
jgi:DNA-binding NtrC family response regulator